MSARVRAPRAGRLGAWLCCGLFAGACGQVQPGAVALYHPANDRSDFFASPWPSDLRLRRGSDGKRHLDLYGFRNPGAQIGEYVRVIGETPLDGFGTHSAAYFRFDRPLDPASLPATPVASLAADASVFVVDVTRDSPSFGKRSPLRVRFAVDPGAYAGKNLLSLLPEPGFPLRERTTYAAVVTSAVRAADGNPVRGEAAFAVQSLPELQGVPDLDLAPVAMATVFTTQDATTIMRDLRAAVYAQAKAPQVADLRHLGSERTLQRYDLYEGTYSGPNYQEGDVPYAARGGRIHLGSDGKPELVRMETLRFALSVPRAPMPAGGWPIILYAHGTGGDYLSFVDDGSAGQASLVYDRADKPVARFAMISIDQVLHGPRDPQGLDPDLTFFNFQNIEAARDNPKQGALDNFQLLRLVETMRVDRAPKTGAPIRFDAERIYFKGHSQGGLTGPLFLAFEPKVKAAVLSGAGADLILALLQKKEPIDIPKLVEAVVGEAVDAHHPLLNLLQTYLESSDPGNHGRLFFREPPVGMAPKSIFHSLGIVDGYTPIETIKAFTLAMGAQPVMPLPEPIENLVLAPYRAVDAPVEKNVAAGAATAVLCEYKVPLNPQGRPVYDGHFVVMRHPAAVLQSNFFLASHARGGVAQLIRP